MQDREVKQIREALTALSDEYWRKYAARVESKLLELRGDELADSAAVEGQFAVLTGVDFTRQEKHADKPAVCHVDSAGQVWGIAMDERFNRMLAAAQDVQLSFGWTAQPTHQVIGSVLTTDPAFGIELLDQDAQWAPILQLRALRTPSQFAVFDHPRQGPRVPGLNEAKKRLKEARAEKAKPAPKEGSIQSPRDMFSVLVKTLHANDMEAFRELWIKPARAMTRRRFYNYLKNFDACGGKVEFDRYDDRLSPENVEKTGMVKMFVRRENLNGHVSTSPLTLVREEGEWRFKTGRI